MKILGVDLGKNTGVVLYDTDKKEVTFNITLEVKDVEEFGDAMKPLLHRFEFDVIVSSYPTRFYWVVMSHGKQMGILEYFASKRNVQVVYTNDSSAKKLVFGSGKMPQADIAVRFRAAGFNLDSDHEFDGLMFCKWFELSSKE